MNHVTVGKINPFLAAHCGMLPAGPVLFLGVGDGTEIVHLAVRGHAVTAFEQDAGALAHARALAAAAGVSVHWQHRERSRWRLGFEQWAGIVALFPGWPTAERRRLLGAVPNALKPGGSLLFEGFAEGPGGPLSLSDDELDPADVRAELEILHLARFATRSRPVRSAAGDLQPTWVLQVVGTHLEAAGDAEEFDQPPAPRPVAIKAGRSRPRRATA